MAVAYLIIPVQPALQTVPAFCGRSGVLPFGLSSLGSLYSPTIPTVPTDARRSKGISLSAGKSPASGSAPLPLLLLPAGLGVTPPAAVTPAVTSPGVTQAVTSPGVTLAVTSSGVTQAVTSPGVTQAVTSPGVTQAVTSPGVTQAAVTGCDGVTANQSLSALTTPAPGNAISDPLSGWMEQKLPPQSSWEYPLLPAQALEQELPLDAGIPEDLQDVLLDETPAGAVPALPGDAADCLLEELISGSVRENPGLFDDVSPAEGGEVSCAALEAGVMMEEVPPVQVQSAGVPSPTPLLMAQPPVGFSLSPGPQQQLTLESWMPTLCPSPGESPVSPVSECSVELAPAPDWRPGPAARRGGARRPRPYDKETVRSAGRRQPLTEEEKRERKKEQNKNAATRYRQKKKEEHDIVSGDQEMLETRNKQLRERVGALSRELNYLKQLMREVLRHKRVGV